MSAAKAYVEYLDAMRKLEGLCAAMSVDPEKYRARVKHLACTTTMSYQQAIETVYYEAIRDMDPFKSNAEAIGRLSYKEDG